MRQQISVYLEDVNRHWLRDKSKATGVGMSTLVNLFVAEKRVAEKTNIGEVNRAFENARLADLENQS